MSSLWLLAVSSFLLTLVLTPVCRNLFRRWGVVDRPDGGRHSHPEPVPRVGGIPIGAGFLGAFVILLLSPLAGAGIVAQGLPLAWRVFPAAALVFAVGLVDDLRGLKPWQKLAGQAVAAYVTFWGGVQVTSVAGLTVPPWLSLPLTLLWIIGCSNAFNLIDGVDGLAAGAGLFATITILLGALLTSNLGLALATVPLAGALLGFLRYNFNPASIFLGDSGSLTIGFLLGSFGVLWAQKSATMLGMTAPLMALAVPLIDTGVAMARRFLRRQPIMSADASHIHHRLLARGLTPRRVALLLYGVCGLTAGLSLLSTVAQDQYRGLIILVFCAAAWIGVQHLGYVEFGVAGRMFVRGTFLRHLNSQIALRTFEEALAAAGTLQARWSVVCQACREFGFTRVELRLNGHRFEEMLVKTNGNPVWNLEIPLAGEGRLELTRCFGEAQVPTVVVQFAESLHKNLRANAAADAAAAPVTHPRPIGSSRHSAVAGAQPPEEYIPVAAARPNFMPIAQLQQPFSRGGTGIRLPIVSTGQDS
jgi:UDP-GlcNAc:undecaprenyl-phosphate GlcNAc-1-phosphate transferase